MNVMMSCPGGDVFLGSLDTISNKKNVEYIATEMKKYIDEVGLTNVTQICCDNASNMLGVIDKIIEIYPCIFKQGCVAHTLDFLLED